MSSPEVGKEVGGKIIKPRIVLFAQSEMPEALQTTFIAIFSIFVW